MCRVSLSGLAMLWGLLWAPTSWAENSFFEPDDLINEVGFVAVGNPGFLKIVGEGAQAKGRVTLQGKVTNGTISVDLRPLKTGLALRDEHMHGKYLESSKHSEAMFRFARWTPTTQWSDLPGSLTLKGVTSSVVCRARAIPVSTGFDADLSCPIKLEAYPIGVPSWLGVTVAEEAHVTAHIRFNKVAK